MKHIPLYQWCWISTSQAIRRAKIKQPVLNWAGCTGFYRNYSISSNTPKNLTCTITYWLVARQIIMIQICSMPHSITYHLLKKMRGRCTKSTIQTQDSYFLRYLTFTITSPLKMSCERYVVGVKNNTLVNRPEGH